MLGAQTTPLLAPEQQAMGPAAAVPSFMVRVADTSVLWPLCVGVSCLAIGGGLIGISTAATIGNFAVVSGVANAGILATPFAAAACCSKEIREQGPVAICKD
ncbi:MAG: hypothetical protein K0S29_1071 [Gammaproteobacteria bacterium]|nr:hypothetical protein [Gammaproteobacteria bacterium]